jgi:hypothetical protein
VLWHFCVKTYDARVDNAMPLTTERGLMTRVHKKQGDLITPNGPYSNLSNQSGNRSFQVRFSVSSNERLDDSLRNAFEGPGWPSSSHDQSLSFVFGVNLYADTGYRRRSDQFSRLSEDEVERRIWRNLQSTANNIAKAMTA